MTAALEDLGLSGARTHRTTRAIGVIAGSAVVLACAAVLSVTRGAIPISLQDTVAALAAGSRGHASELFGVQAIVWNLRAPRVLMAVLVGATLGGSGAAMQGLFRNPLADPYLLGVASGAAFGATLAMTLGGQLSNAFAEVPFARGGALGLVPLFAFLGAMGAVLVTLALSRGGSTGRSGTSSLLLAGVVVGSVLVSLTTLLMLRDADRLRAVFSFTMGNLALASWVDLGRVAPYAALGMAVLCALGRGLDALALGEDTARTLGVRAGALRVGVIVGASLATAAAVSFVGIIGFVGLVAPHVMRRLGSPRHRVLLPASALGGAVLLVLADLGGRTVARPAEVPIGVVTTLVGGPFLLWILKRES
jgi:iron complex transport system permease protein